MIDIDVGVHRTHCCKWHGCKYGDENCPVVKGEVEQVYLCEDCMEDLRLEDYYIKTANNLKEIKDFQKRNEKRTDCLSRKALIEHINNTYNQLPTTFEARQIIAGFRACIENFPSTNNMEEVKYGYWIDDGGKVPECSNCHKLSELKFDNCPHCRAIMNMKG